MKEKIFEIFQTDGIEAAFAFLQSEVILLDGLAYFDELAKMVYSKHKDLSLAISIFQKGIEWGEMNCTTENRIDVMSAVKGLNYDLGANTWPGWGDEGIVITAEQIAIGYQAAQRNLELAIELEKGAMRIGRAHWLVGAHQLAVGEYIEAKDNFEHAIRFADEGEVPAEASLSAGFKHVTRLIEFPEDEAALIALDDVIAQLSEMEHGSFFVGQLESTLMIFSKD